MPHGLQPTTTKKEYLLALLEPHLGNLPIKSILPEEVLAAVRKIEAKGNLESA